MHGYKNWKKRTVPKVGERPTTGVVVDASCLPVRDSIARDGFYHGPVEWRSADVATTRITYSTPVYMHGNINVAEFLAIVDAVSLLHQQDDHTTIVYSDSLTAIAWYRRRAVKSKYPRNEKTAVMHGLIDEALAWLKKHNPSVHRVKFWDNVVWGENPADFGRK